MTQRRRAAGLALAGLSGVLFGCFNAVAHRLQLDPVLLAAVAYLTLGTLLASRAFRLRLTRPDAVRLVVVAAVGGAASPILLFWGLRHAATVDAGLLLNLELAATAFLGWAWMRERLDPRTWLGVGVLLLAAVAVSLGGQRSGHTDLLGILLVAASAVGWGLDNVLSGQLVGRHAPIGVIGAKGLVGGTLSLATYLLLRSLHAPGFAAGVGVRDLAWMAGLGAFGLTLSLMAFYGALRRVGATMTSSLNIPATAIAGALGGWILSQEGLTWWHAAAVAAVAAGVWLLHPHPAPKDS